MKTWEVLVRDVVISVIVVVTTLVTQHNVVATAHVTLDVTTGLVDLVIPVAIHLVMELYAAVTRVAIPAAVGFKEQAVTVFHLSFLLLLPGSDVR